MYWIIAKHYCRSLMREQVLPLALAVFIAAMIYPILRGHWRIAEERRVETAFLQRAHEVVIRNQQLARKIEERIAAGLEQEQVPPPFGTQHPRYAATWSHPPALLPTSALFWLATGQSSFYAAGYGGPELAEISPITNPLRLRLGEWDVAFAVVNLLPLFILALTFDLIASDRETGRLQVAISQPVSTRTILFTRAATAAVIVLAATALAYSTGIAMSGSTPGGWMDRALLGGAAILLYAVFWLALSVGVNAVGQSAANNALTLTALWVLFVVLIPFAIDQAATRTYPVAPHSEITNAIRSAREDLNSVSRDQLIRDYYRLRPQAAQPADGLSDLGLLYLERTARSAALEQRSDTAQQHWEESLERQQEMTNRLAVISPSALLTITLIELAGTSRSRYLDFVRQKREYEESYVRFFLPRLLALPNSIFTSADYNLIPTMQYRELDGSVVFNRVAVGLNELALTSLIMLIAACILSWSTR